MNDALPGVDGRRRRPAVRREGPERHRRGDHLARRRPSSPAATSRRCCPGDPGRRAGGLRAGRGHQGRPAPARDLRQAGRRRDQRRRPRRRPRDHAWPATTGSSSTTPRSSSACPRSPSACCPAAAASPARSGCSASSPALMDVLLQGTRFKPAAAKEKGLVDELVDDRDDLVPAAKEWIKANADDPRPHEPVGPRRLQDARRHARPPRRSRRSCRPSRRCCASRPRARSTRHRGRSCPPRSRVRRSTSTPPRRIESRYLAS